MTQAISEEQAILSTLSPAMRRAILSAVPAEPEPEWGTLADYCTGHESLRGDLMGATQYCEGSQVCKQARDAYAADRVADMDRLYIHVTPDVTVGTVVALIGRGLAEAQPLSTVTREHELTDKGMCVLHALRALPADQRTPREAYSRRQRERAYNAIKSARHAYRFANEANRAPQAFAEAVAAALDSVATEGDTRPETLRAIARALKDV